jgi:prepilin peptidase CpaA
MSAIIVFGISSYLAVAALCDLLLYRIPNLLILLGAIAGVTCDLLVFGLLSAGQGLVRSLGLLVLLYPLFLMGVIGAGDVKLVSVCGILIPLSGLGSFIIWSLIWGGLFSLIRMIRQRQLEIRLFWAVLYFFDMFRAGRFFRYSSLDTADSYIPFGVCIFLGYLFSTRLEVL